MLEKTIINHYQVAPQKALSETIKVMNYLERLSFEKVDFVKFVFEKFSSNCAACIPGKIWNYMQNNFTYKQDKFDEVVTAPYVLLNSKIGDCDDFALFAKTCIDILGGFNSSYILFKKEKTGAFSHIACFVNRGTFNNTFIDPIIIDGANQNFNIVPDIYKFYKII